MGPNLLSVSKRTAGVFLSGDLQKPPPDANFIASLIFHCGDPIAGFVAFVADGKEVVFSGDDIEGVSRPSSSPTGSVNCKPRRFCRLARRLFIGLCEDEGETEPDDNTVVTLSLSFAFKSSCDSLVSSGCKKWVSERSLDRELLFATTGKASTLWLLVSVDIPSIFSCQETERGYGGDWDRKRCLLSELRFAIGSVEGGSSRDEQDKPSSSDALMSRDSLDPRDANPVLAREST